MAKWYTYIIEEQEERQSDLNQQSMKTATYK